LYWTRRITWISFSQSFFSFDFLLVSLFKCSFQYIGTGGEKAKQGVKETSNTDVGLLKNYFILTAASLCMSGTSNKHATVFQKQSPTRAHGIYLTFALFCFFVRFFILFFNTYGQFRTFYIFYFSVLYVVWHDNNNYQTLIQQ
jgi:hypothetical protein